MGCFFTIFWKSYNPRAFKVPIVFFRDSERKALLFSHRGVSLCFSRPTPPFALVFPIVNLIITASAEGACVCAFGATGYPSFPIAAFSASLRTWCVLGRSAAPRFLFCYLCRWGWLRLQRRVVCWVGTSEL